jgi:hypothetical protein
MPLHYHNSIVKEQMGSRSRNRMTAREPHYPSPLTLFQPCRTASEEPHIVDDPSKTVKQYRIAICDEPFILPLRERSSRASNGPPSNSQNRQQVSDYIHRPGSVNGPAFPRQKSGTRALFPVTKSIIDAAHRANKGAGGGRIRLKCGIPERPKNAQFSVFRRFRALPLGQPLA